MTLRRLLERRLALALARHDRIAAVNLAQQLWHAGDLRRTAIVGMYSESAERAE